LNSPFSVFEPDPSSETYRGVGETVTTIHLSPFAEILLALPNLGKERKNRRGHGVRNTSLGTKSIYTFFKNGLIFKLEETIGTIEGTLDSHSQCPCLYTHRHTRVKTHM